MKIDPNEIKTILASLEAAPVHLAALSQGLDLASLHTRSEQEPWSVNDILAHLRACADVWGKSILAMLAQDHPTMRYVSPRTHLKKTAYPEQEFPASLAAFTAQRQELLGALKALEPAGWSRGATFTATTRGREGTVLSYAQRLAQHESEHMAQIRSLLQGTRSDYSL
jgi:hypothetical protein